MRTDLVAVMYTGAGGYDPAEAARAAGVLLGYSLGIWAYTLNHILSRAFYALSDTRTPMLVALGMVGVNLALNLTLIWPLREAGLGWATAIAASVQSVALYLCLRRKLARPLLDAPSRAAVARIATATLAMTIILLVASLLLPSPGSWAAHLASLAGLGAAGVGVYALAARLLHLQELHWLVKVR